ncbi:MAG: copper amine oxidase N-terminal domain-containing protein [Abitibacteriaceae bacterium]|nr:copper amine oxidase N-terminal domain-containing protein [Abditibacteriaceae bacterium]
MKAKQNIKKVGIVALAVAGTGLTSVAQAAQVSLNGQPLPTSVSPIMRSGRTLVPMRDIFQALGANVSWNGLTQGITATRGGTNISLQIGNRNAVVNGQRVALEQPAVVYHGSTMVPLRFVSEAMGAQVNWNPVSEIAAISTDGRVAQVPGGQQVAGARQISVPAGAVVRVTLDNSLSSATARTGDRFTATVDSQNPGDSEFPPGSKLVGVVSEVQPKNGNQPGVLDLDFRSVELPGGQRVPLRGSLISLDNNSVDTSTRGRIMAKQGASNNNKDRLKVIGIGAGAGFLLGKLLKQNSTLAAVLGAAGGYLYDRKKNKNDVREAELPAGTPLGVRLDRNITYADASNYYNQRSAYFKM